MNNKPLISVIVPVYNMEKYLHNCLDSIIRQTYSNIEILCVNDGSKDKSLDILTEYAAADKRIKILNKENGGLSSARNTGLMNASGDYIGFIDSDDFISDDFYELLLKACLDNNAGISYASIYRFKENDINALESFSVHTDRVLTSFYDKVIHQNNGSVCNKFFKRDVLFDGAHPRFIFPEGLTWEDSEFLINALYRSEKLVTVSKPIYFYRYTQTSIMNDQKNANRNHENRLIISQHIYDRFKDQPDLRALAIYYIFNVVVDLYTVTTDSIYRKRLQDILGININNKIIYNTRKIGIYLFDFIQLFRIVIDKNKYKFYIFWIPVFSKKRTVLGRDNKINLKKIIIE